ncbi:hypothetical protein DV738_g973, partial [Chaetothyriales sp. CBS 135597]
MASDEDADLPYHAFAQVSRSIHIGNVPPHTTGAEIRDSFAQYGRIISVSPNIYSKVNKGFAFVNFQDVGSAIRAVNASQDRHLFGQPKGRVVVTFQNLLSPRSTTQKRKYPHTAKPGDEWFERKNAGRSAAASVNASSPPRGPKSMTREISPPPVKRARLLKQVPPLSHESRSSNPQMGPERTLEQPQRPQNSAARSTSCKTGIDYWFTRDDNCEDPSRENGYNDDASDSEIKALRKQARLLKRSSTKPPLSVSINPSGPANPKAQAIDLGSKMKTPGVSVPLEEASRSPLEADTGRYLDKDGRPCTRHITCSFWNFGHRCKFRDDECLYAHYDSGQYVSNPSPADGKDPRLAGATHTPAQRTSINPNTSTAPGIQPLSGGAFDDGKPDMQPQTALSPFNGAKVPSANSRLPSASVRETSLPRSDYFADGSHPFVHGSTVAPNPGKGLHCVDTPNSPEPTICSTDGYVQHSASNSVVVEEGGPQGHTATAIPVGTSAADDDAALSTEPTQTPLNPRPESQAPVVTPADERPIEVPQVKHFARPSAVLLDPRKRRKQSKTTTVSLARDLDAEVARPSTVFSSVSLCKACGKKLFGSADHCNACREKSTLASQAAAKIPTPAQSPAAVDDNRSVKDDIGSVNPLADPAPRTESAHDGASIMPAIQSVGGLAPQTGQQDTPVVAGPKAAVTVTPAKRPASSISPLFSKRRLINPLEGPKKPFSTVREPSKPKPSLEDLTQQALRQRGEAEVTGVSRQTTAVKDVSSEKEPHGPTEQDTVDASLERATHDPHPLLQTPFSHALPKAPSGILAQTEPSNRSLEADQIVEEVPSPPRQTSAQSEYSDRSLETDPTVEEGSSPPKQASAQPSQFHPQNHGQHLLDDADDADDEDDEDDEDDLPLRVLKKARLERDGGISQGEIFQDGQGAIGPVTTLEPILEHGEDDPSQDLDDDHDEDEQHGSPEELVVCEDVARKSVLSDTANRPVSTEVANYAQHVQRSADAGFDEAAHLQRLRENGAMIEDESDEEASDIEMSDSATSPEPKAQEAAEHLGLLRACPVKTSRDLFEVAPRFRPVTQPAGPARYQPRGQTGQSKKKLWENLSTYQCRYQEQRFGDPHQTIEVPPERSLFAIVRESAPQMAHADVVERPSIFDVAPVVLKKRKMQFADFVGVLRDPVIIRDGAMRDLVFVDKSRLENETRGRRVAMEKFPFIKG